MVSHGTEECQETCYADGAPNQYSTKCIEISFKKRNANLFSPHNCAALLMAKKYGTPVSITEGVTMYLSHHDASCLGQIGG